MAEYYAVLSKAVGSLDANAAEARRTVYDKARNALIAQLKAIAPPLSTAEISRQRLELEEAIRRVEREASTSSLPAGNSRTATPPPAAESFPPPQPQQQDTAIGSEGAGEDSPQDVFRRAIQEAESRGATPTTVERAQVPARVEVVVPSPYDDGSDYRSAARIDRPVHDDQRPYTPPGYGGRRGGSEPRLAPDYDYDYEQPEPARPQPQYAPDPYLDRRDRPSSAASRKKTQRYLQNDDDRKLIERDARPSRLPTFFLFLLIAGMAVGLGALGWTQRDMIKELIASFDSGTGLSSAPAASSATEDSSAPSKNVDRLLDDEAGAARTVRAVDDEAGAGDGEALPLSDTPEVASAPATDDGGAAGDSLVAQKAVLYEEPLDQSADGVVAIGAVVTWSFIPDGPNGAELEARLEVPERKLKIKMAIRRNTDETLPASHLVEVVADVPAGFPGKGIRNVPRIVLKPTEDARGQPLIGASAKVADGFFWIALSAVEADVNSNLSLLRERGWIDLPLVYESGQRAILTFEKGTPGDRVFEKAVAAWNG